MEHKDRIGGPPDVLHRVSNRDRLRDLLAQAKPKTRFARIDTLVLTADKYNVTAMLNQLVCDLTVTGELATTSDEDLERIENRIYAIARALEAIDDADVTVQ